MVVGESCIILNIATEMGSLWFLFFYFFGCYVFVLFICSSSALAGILGVQSMICTYSNRIPHTCHPHWH